MDPNGSQHREFSASRRQPPIGRSAAAEPDSACNAASADSRSRCAAERPYSAFYGSNTVGAACIQCDARVLCNLVAECSATRFAL